MLHSLWNAVLYKPLINALALLTSLVPGGDVGIAIILLTLLVKIVLFPLTQKAITSQAKLTALNPELNKIKNSGKSQEEQARAQFELYKQHGVNPFSGCLIQIPVIIVFISLYFVFGRGMHFDAGNLYSFIKAPGNVNFIFLGLVDLAQKSLVLAILAGISQYFQARFMPQPPMPKADVPETLSDNFAKSMSMQMKYIFPFLMGVIAYRSGALALYWITSNIFAVGQQIYATKTKKD